ncbi:Uncharacterised protein [Mycobacteroides abscessus subsp. abscessus]|nr:Uncharacterised protein [Mycobacteroides abscessus subsp. abscessus]
MGQSLEEQQRSTIGHLQRRGRVRVRGNGFQREVGRAQSAPGDAFDQREHVVGLQLMLRETKNSAANACSLGRPPSA